MRTTYWHAAPLVLDQEVLMRATVCEDTSLWVACRGVFNRHTSYDEDLGDAYMPASIPTVQAELKAPRCARSGSSWTCNPTTTAP